jgi:ATP-dependent protease ClpP protease subunit
MNNVILNKINEQNNVLIGSDEMYISFHASISSDFISLMIEEIEKENPRSVVLYIDTDGGDPREPIRFFNYIKARNIDLNTVNLSCVGSAGVALFAAGNKRYANPYSMFVLHEPAPPASYPTRKLTLANIAYNEQIDKNTYEFIFDRCGIKKETWDEWHSLGDHAVFSAEALEKGLATDIGTLQIPNNTKVIPISGH